MNLVAYGGGVNSTAMLIGMKQNNIVPDLILFADTGAERPETYTYIDTMNQWLDSVGFPQITVVKNVDKKGDRLSLEDECLQCKNLPAIAYGFKTCSLKHKISPQDKFCNSNQGCKEAWANGEKVVKWVGYDAGEERRKTNAFAFDLQDKKFTKQYPLIEWGWYREDCVKAIQDAGLPIPGKSSCFFCPSMKKAEIYELKKTHPDLLQRALAIEDNAAEGLKTVKGLGRDWAWRTLVYGDPNQISICGTRDVDDESTTPCGCYDGE